MFENKAKIIYNVVLREGRLLALTANIRQDCINVFETNALAYFSASSVTMRKFYDVDFRFQAIAESTTIPMNF